MKNNSANEKICSCIKNIVVDNNGKAVIIPDFKLFSNPDYSVSPLEGCFCPRTTDEFKKCLSGCLVKVLSEYNHHNSKIESVFIRDESGNELQI